MEFNLLCTVSNGEVISVIDGKSYKHFLDAAKMSQFKRIYDKAPGKALQYLKEQCSGYEVDDKRYTRVEGSNKFVEFVPGEQYRYVFSRSPIGDVVDARKRAKPILENWLRLRIPGEYLDLSKAEFVEETFDRRDPTYLDGDIDRISFGVSYMCPLEPIQTGR